MKKSDMYRAMVITNSITENGLPTEEALKKGLIKDFYEEGFTFEEFLPNYPIFEIYNSSCFQQIDGFWEIPLSVKKDLQERMNQKKFHMMKRFKFKNTCWIDHLV